MTLAVKGGGAALERGSALLERGRAGDIAAVSQLITALESKTEVGEAIRGPVHAAGGSAHIVGITGAPGSGKSTLVRAIATELRSRGRTVGIVAVDPSSSLSGGAILGDRIRMQDHVLDPGVFARSMSSRGYLGGVSRATVDAVAVLDATGWDWVIVETVGVGQAEVEIVGIAQSTVVVSVPGLGDDVQAIKAGLLEVADIHVVNKEDRPDANKTIAELVNMLRLGGAPPEGGWAIPVLGTVGLDGRGVPELVDELDRHLGWLRGSGELGKRERKAAENRIRAVAKDMVTERMTDADFGDAFAATVEKVVLRQTDPHAAAISLMEHMTSSATKERE
jgi:LAO/AO transport system kinase